MLYCLDSPVFDFVNIMYYAGMSGWYHIIIISSLAWILCKLWSVLLIKLKSKSRRSVPWKRAFSWYIKIPMQPRTHETDPLRLYIFSSSNISNFKPLSSSSELPICRGQGERSLRSRGISQFRTTCSFSQKNSWLSSRQTNKLACFNLPHFPNHTQIVRHSIYRLFSMLEPVCSIRC